MEQKEPKTFLTVAPFECAWLENLPFKEAGRGCVAFDAFAHNDVTVVFREKTGSQHYHYKRDNSPHYTVIIGSHRNKRLNIEVDGKTAVDVVGLDLHCSSAFQSYWISVYDGLISIGKGRYPFQSLVFQWLDSNPNRSVQYVGLSSWDRHVGYRNVSVLPLTGKHVSLWKNPDDGDDEIEEGCCIGGDFKSLGLGIFLESWELSDVVFLVGKEERVVPGHKVVLAAAGNFGLSSSGENVVRLEDYSYPVVHALLEYIYTGNTKVPESHLSSLRYLSLRCEVNTLARQCEEMIERFKLNKKLFDSGKCVEISYPSARLNCSAVFLNRLPIDIKRLNSFRLTSEYSDVDIYIEGHGLVARLHRIILSLWSAPFTKMFTNGMIESISPEIFLKDVCSETFKIMLDFMYSGEINQEDITDIDMLLLQLLLMADQFGVSPLHQECCKQLLEHLSEDSVCQILLVVQSVPSCKIIEETCERKFAMHFDYCTTASDFVMLDETTFRNILQHQDLTVTSEERVLNAVLLWCCEGKELFGWEIIDEMLLNSAPESVFRERLKYLDGFLNLVRFPLLSSSVLQKLERSNLSTCIPTLSKLVKEAIGFLEFGSSASDDKDINKYQHRKSSFKELQYICDGDSNGVLYFAGTSYGQHQWVNPVLSKRVIVTASSPISRFTDPKVIASRSYQGTSFAGPRVENGRNTAWWMVDIGHSHQLMCNYYTLRQDGSTAFIRNWSFQGSMDGNSWTNLRVHENDETMMKPGQFASWPVVGPNALLPFRYFRVVLTAPTADTTNPWNLCICFLELYGYFR